MDQEKRLAIMDVMDKLYANIEYRKLDFINKNMMKPWNKPSISRLSRNAGLFSNDTSWKVIFSELKLCANRNDIKMAQPINKLYPPKKKPKADENIDRMIEHEGPIEQPGKPSWMEVEDNEPVYFPKEKHGEIKQAFSKLDLKFTLMQRKNELEQEIKLLKALLDHYEKSLNI